MLHERAAVVVPRTVVPAVKKLGLYVGAREVQRVRAFESWLGKPILHVEDFIDGSTWSSIENPSWWLDGWQGQGYAVELSIPIIPQTGGTIQAGAHGDYDAHFVALARNLCTKGYGGAMLRLGWEFNGGWFKWTAKDDPASFAEYWRRIVKAMRSVGGARFRFDWSPTLGKANMVNVEAAYPGDEYVNRIGTSAYDQSWIPAYKDPAERWNDMLTQPYGLNWLASYARSHSKKINVPEWGLCIRSDGHGGGDTPLFIERMHEWIKTNNVGAACYFEFDAPDGKHRLLNFPKSQPRFKELFG